MAQGIAVGLDGTVYVVDLWNYQLEGFDPRGNYLFTWDLGKQGYRPWDVAVDPDGDIFVGAWGYATKYSPGGVFIKRWCFTWYGDIFFGCLADHYNDIWGARGIVVDSQKRVYVTNPVNYAVMRFIDDSATLTRPITWGTLKARYGGPGN